MSQDIQTYYGLQWNPFSTDKPVEGIVTFERWSQFFWRIENLIMDGGFGMITGDPGVGKSTTMRALFDRISQIKDVQVQQLTRPQSGLSDFYRELGQLFNLDLKVSNRYSGYSALREKWQSHINTALFRPVLLIDEAQEMQTPTMSELRLLMSKKFDSEILLTVIFSGDLRLQKKFQDETLRPIDSRIRTRLTIDPPSKQELIQLMHQLLKQAGRPDLMTDELINTVTELSLQNPRILMNYSIEILNLGFKKKVKFLDVDLLFELYPPHSKSRKAPKH